MSTTPRFATLLRTMSRSDVLRIAAGSTDHTTTQQSAALDELERRDNSTPEDFRPRFPRTVATLFSTALRSSWTVVEGIFYVDLFHDSGASIRIHVTGAGSISSARYRHDSDVERTLAPYMVTSRDTGKVATVTEWLSIPSTYVHRDHVVDTLTRHGFRDVTVEPARNRVTAWTPNVPHHVTAYYDHFTGRITSLHVTDYGSPVIRGNRDILSALKWVVHNYAGGEQDSPVAAGREYGDDSPDVDALEITDCPAPLPRSTDVDPDPGVTGHHETLRTEIRTLATRNGWHVDGDTFTRAGTTVLAQFSERPGKPLTGLRIVHPDGRTESYNRRTETARIMVRVLREEIGSPSPSRSRR